jgi:transposase
MARILWAVLMNKIASGKIVVRKALRRPQVLPFFAKLPPCLIGIGACGTLHHWARELAKLGHKFG